MPKRTLFTNITPLPPQVSREVAIAMLHNHDEMIELNPLVIEHHPIKTPRDAPADEFLDCVWQELTDKIHYLPGGLVKGKVTYKACFHDTPTGLQTHIYAPMGLDIREKWSVGGTLPGEPPEPRELGLDTPRTGLYLREDGDMRCNIMLTSFVRKNLDNSHKVLVERILKKAERVEEHLRTSSPTTSRSNGSITNTSSFQRGSHMAQSQFVNSPRTESFGSPLASPSRSQFGDMSVHPAFRDSQVPESYRMSGHTLPPYQPPVHPPPDIQTPNEYPQDVKHNPYGPSGQQRQQQQSPQHLQPDHQPSSSRLQPHQNRQPQQTQQPYFPPPPSSSPQPSKEFVAELPGSSPEPQTRLDPRSLRGVGSVSDMSQTDMHQPHSPSQISNVYGSDRGSIVSEPSQISTQPYQYNPQHFSRRVDDLRQQQYAELPTPPPDQTTFSRAQIQRPEQPR